jgi:hypothetical protein
MTRLPSQATLRIREALESLLESTDQAQRREVTEMFLGPDIFVALLRRPQVLEGEWEDTERTVDLLDLMDHFGDDSSPADATCEPIAGERPSPVPNEGPLGLQ